MLGHISQIGHAFAAPSADFKVVLHFVFFGQSPQQGNVDGHSGSRKISVRLGNFVEVGKQLVDFQQGKSVFEAVFSDDILLVAAFVLQNEVEQIRMPDDAPDGFGEFLYLIHFLCFVSRNVA